MSSTAILVVGSLCLSLILLGFIITIIDFRVMHAHPDDYVDDDDHDRPYE